MSEQEQNKHLAEKVMQWYDDDDGGYRHKKRLSDTTTATEWACWIEEFTPRTDLNHAEKALVKYNPSDVRMWRNSQSDCWHVMILGRDGYKDRATSINKSLSAAITEALCQSSGYKEVSE